MGGVFIGIALALFIEAFRERPQGLVGLGLGGAIAINLCGGLVLMGWLIFGKYSARAFSTFSILCSLSPVGRGPGKGR